MAWKYYTFCCSNEHTFDCLVDDREPAPDPCPTCGVEGAVRIVNGCSVATLRVPMYPGSKNQNAAGGAAARRPAEKKGRQVSMAGTSKKGS